MTNQGTLRKHEGIYLYIDRGSLLLIRLEIRDGEQSEVEIEGDV